MLVHSATKYLNGHSDMIGGVIVARDAELGERLAFLQNAIGARAEPVRFLSSDCVVSRRSTSGWSVTAPTRRSLREWLEHHPAVERVIYPGLSSHPHHELAQRQMSSFGGMISVILRGDLDSTRRMLESCRLFALAESLGGVESLIEHPAIMTHASLPAEQRSAAGISDTLIRLSVRCRGPAGFKGRLRSGVP